MFILVSNRPKSHDQTSHWHPAGLQRSGTVQIDVTVDLFNGNEFTADRNEDRNLRDEWRFILLILLESTGAK